ncbi:MAG: trypsin-like serine protease [Planctomycetes bacterium]|nr:trypsin-like serine protease [Planctomycetota bacterium]
MRREPIGKAAAMDVVCRCANCATQFKVDAKYSGRKAKCPRCAAVTIVPTADTVHDAIDRRPDAGRFQTGDATQDAVTIPELPDFPAQKTKAASAPSPSTAKPKEDPAELPLPSIVKAAPGKEPSRNARTTRRRRSPLVWIAATALVAVLLVVLGVVVVAQSWFGWERSPSLVLDWPERDRTGDAAIDLDGRKIAIPSTGEIRVELRPGKHRLVLKRRGYPQIEWSFAAEPGKTIAYKPVWESPRFGPDGTGTVGQTNPAKTGDDVTSSPLGFPGWLQILDQAKKRATEKKRDILIVFAGSDWHAKSIKMANNIFSNPKFLAYAEPRFSLVVIDVPRTSAGFNLLADSAQNQFLLQQYEIRSTDRLPQVILADAKGQPYARDGAFDDTVEKYLQHLTLLQSNRTERDQILAAARAGQEKEKRLTAAERGLQWLNGKAFARFYARDLQEWLTLARRLDPKNEGGRQELFFEGEWSSRLQTALRDSSEMRNWLNELISWSQQHKFQDSNRAVRLHLLGAVVASERLRDQELTSELVRLAELYSPKDEKLREAMSAISKQMRERNQISSGTGFIVSLDGHILSNHHVIEGPGKTVVRVPGTDQRVAATVVALDDNKDLAVLKANPEELGLVVPLHISNVKVGRGTNVAAFGYPLGDLIGSGLKLTSGLITGTDETGMMIIDARINPGNSGGPLCDKSGHVIGMITAKSRAGDGLDSYGVAIPAKDLLAFLTERVPSIALQPADAASPTILEWPQVDSLVQNSVVMILKIRDGAE